MFSNILTVSTLATLFMATGINAIPSTTPLTPLGPFNEASPQGARLIDLCSTPKPGSELETTCSVLFNTSTASNNDESSLLTKRGCNYASCEDCAAAIGQCGYCFDGDLVADDLGVALACASCLIKCGGCGC